MALTSGNEISIVLSGGTVNLDPNSSLGGDPSNAPIPDGILNNLFDDISPEESDIGHEDYRCIYFFNDGDSDVYSVVVYIAEDFENGAVIELGIRERNETQRIQITDAALTGGSMTLSYAGIQFLSEYNSDLGDWAIALQDTLNALLDLEGDPLLREVTVNAQATGSSTIIFDIIFNGIDGKRNHPTIQVDSNDFSPAVTITVSTPQEGAPINTIAPDIGLETTPPGGITFYAPSELSPITLPLLKPEDGFPLWVKRVVDPNTVAVADDGFRIRFSGESLPLDS